MATRTPYRSYAFNPARQDTSDFDCGVPLLNSWLRDHADDARRKRIARCFVWINDEYEVQAYYSLSAHSVLRGAAPSRVGRGMPESVPAALIGKLALNRPLQGKGLGGVLVLDAASRVLDAMASGLAVRAVVVDAISPEAVRFYVRLGFVSAPGMPDRLMIHVSDLERALKKQ